VILRRQVECPLPESFAAPACRQSALRDTPTVQGIKTRRPGRTGTSRGSVGGRGDNGTMSDDGAGLHVRQAPRRGPGELGVADLTMLVRVPGQPTAVRVYSDDERVEAARYAAEVGGVVVPLPFRRRSATGLALTGP
jgi:hypothetical protein